MLLMHPFWQLQHGTCTRSQMLCSDHPPRRGHSACQLIPNGAAGTYRGMMEKLDHLQSLGINCLELLPVQEFNEMEYYQASLSRPRPE